MFPAGLSLRTGLAMALLGGCVLADSQWLLPHDVYRVAAGLGNVMASGLLLSWWRGRRDTAWLERHQASAGPAA